MQSLPRALFTLLATAAIAAALRAAPAGAESPRPDAADRHRQLAELRSAQNTATVNVLYRQVLGRTPDPEGLKTYLGELDAGRLTPAGLRKILVDSDEFRTIRAQRKINRRAERTGGSNADYVASLYREILGREPDADGLKNQLADLDFGRTTRDQLRKGFLESPEYRELKAKKSGGGTPAGPATTPPGGGTGSLDAVLNPSTPGAGSPGGPVGGDAASFDLSKVKVMGGSADVLTWPVTSKVTSVSLADGKFRIDHTKRGQWPPVCINPADGTLQEGTVWVFFRIGGQWYGTGGERLRPSQSEKELSRPSQIGVGWLYDANRWGPMTNYTPKPGELVGFMVAAGSTRSDSNVKSKERSNVVLIPFPADDQGGTYPPFAAEK